MIDLHQFHRILKYPSLFFIHLAHITYPCPWIYLLFRMHSIRNHPLMNNHHVIPFRFPWILHLKPFQPTHTKLTYKTSMSLRPDTKQVFDRIDLCNEFELHVRARMCVFVFRCMLYISFCEINFVVFSHFSSVPAVTMKSNGNSILFLHKTWPWSFKYLSHVSCLHYRTYRRPSIVVLIVITYQQRIENHLFYLIFPSITEYVWTKRITFDDDDDDGHHRTRRITKYGNSIDFLALTIKSSVKSSSIVHVVFFLHWPTLSRDLWQHFFSCIQCEEEEEEAGCAVLGRVLCLITSFLHWLRFYCWLEGNAFIRSKFSPPQDICFLCHSVLLKKISSNQSRLKQVSSERCDDFFFSEKINCV